MNPVLPEQLDLVNGLVNKVLVVLDDLQAAVEIPLQILHVHALGERGRPQKLHDSISPGNQGPNHNWEILRILESRSFSVDVHCKRKRVVNGLFDFQGQKRVEARHELSFVQETNRFFIRVQIGFGDIGLQINIFWRLIILGS